jgi:L-ascorbate metabolism protein UlaG (beta-lactamase superfamily)
MKLTKYEHACFSIEKDGDALLVDPGTYTTDLVIPQKVSGVIITHEHADHFNPHLIETIQKNNPDAVLLGPASLTRQQPAFSIRTVSPGDSLSVGAFSLQFFGGSHAIIHSSIPQIENVGVLIDNRIYYPGDSLFVPDIPVDILAIPAAAPWLKIGEAMDFLAAITPRFAFPTHDAIAAPSGKQLADRLLGDVATKHGIDYQRITTLEI